MLRRSSGKDLVESRVFCPVAFSGLKLPDTLRDRSIEILMRKPPKGKHAEAYYPRIHDPVGIATGEAIGAWVKTVILGIANAWTELPDGITDRKQEVWEPIVAIGDAAGPEWAKRSRRACRELALNSAENSGPSPVDQLLIDLRAVWPHAKDKSGAAQPVRNVSTQTLLIALFSMPDSRYARQWEPIAASRETKPHARAT